MSVKRVYQGRLVLIFKSVVFIVSVLVAGCAGQEGAPRSDAVVCPNDVVISDRLSPSLPAEFVGLRYIVDVSSHGESGACVRRVQRAPEHAVKFGSGVLFGGDRGEWGGELFFRDGAGKDRKLLDENVVSIHVIGAEAYVFTGLNHMGKSFGSIYRVDIDPQMLASLPVEVAKFDSPPSVVSYGERSGFRLQFDDPEESGPNNGKAVKFRCFSVADKGMLTEFACGFDSSRP